MKKVAEFIEGTFVDYKGDKREYTICALSCPIEEGDDKASDSEVKQLRLGIAVRRDGDEYVRGIGMAEAERKAKENPFSVLRSDTCGVINSTMVQAILEQEAEFFENNPGKYIKAYNDDAERYFYELELEEKRQKMSKKMQDIHDYLLVAPDWELEILVECLMYDAELQRKGKL